MNRFLLVLAIVLLPILLGGCNTFNDIFNSDSDKTPAITKEPAANPKLPPAPAYAGVVEQYNERIAKLDRFYARVNIQVTYTDANGQIKTEDPEGPLQVVRPNKMLLSLGKAGKTLFLFGCDPQRYWWFDLTDPEDSFVAIGKHELFNEATAKKIGLRLRPLDLIRVLAITPYDPAAPGATQWSNDGKQIGITTAVGKRGYQRLWIDKKSFMPISMEIFGPLPGRPLLLTADYEGEESVELADGRRRPSISSRIYLVDLETKTKARITLTSPRDNRVSDKAFDLAELKDNFPVKTEFDLDKTSKPTK